MLIKEADLKQSVTDYFQSKSEMGLINLLAPSVIGVAVNAIFGTTWVGRGIDLLLRMIGVDFKSLLGSLVTKLCGEIRDLALFKGNKLTPSEVESKVEDSVKKAMASTLASSELKTQSYYQGGVYKTSGSIIKQSASSSAMASGLADTSNFLTKSLGFIFKVALAAAGMELFADLLKSSFGMKSDLDFGSFTGIFSSDLNRKISPKKSKQTKFPKNPNFVNQEVSKIYGSKDRKTIKDTYISWANEAYLNINQQDLEKSEDLERLVEITSQISLNVILGNFFMVPTTLPTKLDIVDFFIDDVANASVSSTSKGQLSIDNELPSRPASGNLKTSELTSSQQSEIDQIKQKGFSIAAEYAKQKLLKLPTEERDSAVAKAKDKLEKFESRCRATWHFPTEEEVKQQIDSI